MDARVTSHSQASRQFRDDPVCHPVALSGARTEKSTGNVHSVNEL
jgi:hypothetical protein